MPSLLYSMRNVLVCPPSSAEDVWGVGYYADDHALIIRKPGNLLTSRSFYELASSVRSRVLVASVHPGSQKHAAPYRFRRWMFASDGDLSALSAVRGKILEALPDFVRTEVMNGSPGELAFGMVLKELHTRGILGDSMSEGPAIADALKRTHDAMGMLAQEAGLPAPEATFAATNGRGIAVGRMGPAIHWKRQEGLEGPPEGSMDPSAQDLQRVAEALKSFRAIVVASEVTPRNEWTELKAGAVLWVDRSLAVSES
jgi:glutamine amidotransferase